MREACCIGIFINTLLTITIKRVITYRYYKKRLPRLYILYSWETPQLGSRLGGTITYAKLLRLVIRGKPASILYILYGPLPIAKAAKARILGDLFSDWSKLGAIIE